MHFSYMLWNNFLQKRNAWSPPRQVLHSLRHTGTAGTNVSWSDSRGETGKRAAETFSSVSGQAEISMGDCWPLGLTQVHILAPCSICGSNLDYSKQSLTFMQSNFFLPFWQTNWKCDWWQMAGSDRRLSDAVHKEDKNIHFSPIPNTHSLPPFPHLLFTFCLAKKKGTVPSLSWKSFQNLSSKTTEPRH